MITRSALPAPNHHGGEFTEAEYLIASPTIKGYALDQHQWVQIFLSYAKEYQWDEQGFHKLVLAKDKKDPIEAMISGHRKYSPGLFGDLIQGKGQGLCLLLHGPPGCGKTLTAEAISGHLHAPLYSIMAGNLGFKPGEVSRKLHETFRMTGRWKAILLLDEADHLLEQRGSDLIRDALVGIFLSAIEKHQGILILTTNRMNMLDDALFSRISLSVAYNKLNREERAELWGTFLENTDRNCESGWSGAIEEWSENEINGRQVGAIVFTGFETFDKLTGWITRQIKNTIRMAEIFAKHKGGRLSVEHVTAAIKHTLEFKKDSLPMRMYV